MHETYRAHVGEIEQGLGAFAFKSTDLMLLTDGTDAIKSFEDQWATGDGKARLSGRTPLMLERDRILYSDELRRQADKHHTLFHKRQRVSRDYTTHTLRVAQVARSVGRRLGLNSDLAEAIAFGSKVGGVAFLHVAKKTVDDWICERLREVDDATARSEPKTETYQEALLDVAEDGSITLPKWITALRAGEVRGSVARYLPWAAGSAALPAYSSGQQSYWLLSTNPFLLRAKPAYTPQTMYGVWRHSLEATPDANTFRHRITVLAEGGPSQLRLTEEHLTHEAVVVRYADDITWVIENLNEANTAASLAGERNSVFGLLALELDSEQLPDALHRALQPVGNAGGLYTYFIDDLVRTSAERFQASDVGPINETEPLVALSGHAARILRLMKEFLSARVFSDDRIRLRNHTLEVISRTILDLLYESQAEALVEVIERRGKIEMWPPSELERALKLAANDATHRVQACVDAFSLMSDRDVYDFIGLEAL